MKHNLWVKPIPYEQRRHATIAGPDPEKAGLRDNAEYLVLDIHDDGRIFSEAYFSLVNEVGEVWFVSNRYFHVSRVTNMEGIPIPTMLYIEDNDSLEY